VPETRTRIIIEGEKRMHRSPATFTPRAITGALAALLLAAPALAADPAEVEKLRKQADGIAKEVEGIRHLPLKREVEKGILDRDELRKFITDELKKELPPEKAHAIEKSYAKIGLMKPGLDLFQTQVDLLTEQIAAFYNPETKQLYMIEHGGPDQEIIMAHELTHAIQDQNFDLAAIEKTIVDNDDRSLALTSVIEGDATVAMIAYLLHHQGANIDVKSLPDIGMILNLTNSLGSMLGGDSGQEKMKAAPKILSENMLFGYVQGASFCQRLIKKGGSYDAVSQAFKDRPQSSKQIMHPERYTGDKRDTPTQVTLPDLAGGLGSGWTLLMKNVMGEFDTALLFKEKLRASEADRAADGWAGDQWQCLEGPKGEVVFCWYTVWDTEKDAKEFNDTYQKFHDAHADGSDATLVLHDKTVIVVDGGGEGVRKKLLEAITSGTTTKLGYDDAPVTAVAGAAPQADGKGLDDAPNGLHKMALAWEGLKAPEGWQKPDRVREGTLVAWQGPNGERVSVTKSQPDQKDLAAVLAQRKQALARMNPTDWKESGVVTERSPNGCATAEVLFTTQREGAPVVAHESFYVYHAQSNTLWTLSITAPQDQFKDAVKAIVAANPDASPRVEAKRKKDPTLY
jgi:hypothetical protein